MAKFLSGAGKTALALLVLGGGLAAARAEPTSEAPTTLIDAFDQTVLGVMKDAGKLGYQGRYDTMEPAIKRTFNVPLMTQLVVGQAWTGWTQEQRDEVTDAFARVIIATYARRFDGYSGENFVIDGTRPNANGAIVMTRLTLPKDPPITINYLIRNNADGRPQIVDVYLTGTISELATRRSEFGAVLERDGFKGLIAALDKKASSQAN